MAHIIPKNVRRGLDLYNGTAWPSEVWDPVWFGEDLGEYESCIDENGMGDWMIINFMGLGNTEEIDNGNPRSKTIRLLNNPTGFESYQRAEISLANQGCEDAVYSISVTGQVESFNKDEYEIISGRINGELVDWGGYTVEEQVPLEGEDPRTHTFPAETYYITSKFGNLNEGGSLVNNNGITWDVNVPAGPCVSTVITFHAHNGDMQHNELDGLGNAFYDVTITRN
jgi:hypothetical protein